MSTGERRLLAEAQKTKQCSRCGEELPATSEYFYRKSMSSDGLKPACKKCVSEAQGYKYTPKKIYVSGAEKECTVCHKVFPAETEHFHRSKSGAYGLVAICKSCVAVRKGVKNPWSKRGQPKKCNRCGQLYPFTEDYFYKDRTKQTGLKGNCKECERECARQYISNEEVKQARRLYRLSPHGKASDGRYRNSDKGKTTLKKWKKDYEATPKGKLIRLIAAWDYRTRKSKLPNTFTDTDWMNALNYWGNTCAVCGRRAGGGIKLAADHWIALSDPRPDNPGTVAQNIVPLCQGKNGCNNSKGALIAKDWLTQKFGEITASKIIDRIEDYFRWVKSHE